MDFRSRNALLACISLFLWSFGNTLVSTTLIVFLFFQLVEGDFAWRSTVTAALLAAPQIFGFVRTVAPKLLARIRLPLPWQAGLFYTFSGLFILFVPGLTILKGEVPVGWLVFLLVGLWSTHHLNEYIGNIALDTWIGRLIGDREQRGRYYGRRQRYALIGAIVASGLSFWVKGFFPETNLLILWTLVGAGMIILSNLPFLFCQDFPERVADEPTAISPGLQKNDRASSLFGPLKSFSFCLFLAYSGSFSFIGGLSSSAQFQFVAKDLNIGFEKVLVFIMVMRAAQMGLSFLFGKLSDLGVSGNRIAMTISQFSSAAGLLALAFATKDNGLVLGAYVLWSGYVGLNIGVSKHLQYLGDATGMRPACFSLYFAVGGICYSSSLILAGIALDVIQQYGSSTAVCFTHFTYFGSVLLLCAGLRFLLVPIVFLCVRKS